jgi:hypothetical protein
MSRLPRRLAIAGAIAAVLGSCAMEAEAQRPRSTSSRAELGVVVTAVGPFSLGTAVATLTTPGGGALTLFTTRNGIAPSAGLEIQAARRLGGRVVAEATGGWSVGRLRTSIAGDTEGASDTTLTERLARYSIEGAVVVEVATHARATYFVRGGAGWMIETAGDQNDPSRGAIGNAGMGVKYWWHRPTRGGAEVGLRLEGRALIRRRGVMVSGHDVAVAPAANAGIMFGF